MRNNKYKKKKMEDKRRRKKEKKNWYNCMKVDTCVRERRGQWMSVSFIKKLFPLHIFFSNPASSLNKILNKI